MRLRLIRSFDVPANNNENEVAVFEFIFQDNEICDCQNYFMSIFPCGNRKRKNDAIHTRSRGLCNGTRFFLTTLEDHVLQAKIMTGASACELLLIPRLSMTPSDSKIPSNFNDADFISQFPMP
ncbi:hypothetical protein OROGR_007770 [Orobanche gracilis]